MINKDEFMNFARSEALKQYEESSYHKPLGKIMWMLAAEKIATAVYDKYIRQWPTENTHSNNMTA